MAHRENIKSLSNNMKSRPVILLVVCIFFFLSLHTTSSSLADKTTMLNDDEYLASKPDDDKPISRAVYMSDAVRRGIENMIDGSPFRR